MFAALRQDPELYGVLRPRAAGLTAKSLSRDTALLLLTLQNPSRLPQYAIDDLGERCDSIVGKMVLDGILEIEENGVMISGPAALGAVTGSETFRLHQDTLAALSLRALAYAEALDVLDVSELSMRLYAYNRIPATSHWLRAFPDDPSVRKHLGVDKPALNRLLSGISVELPPRPNEAWIVWQSRQITSAKPRAGIYKLYVSPALDDLAATFSNTMCALARSKAFQWKVGRNVYGLLRPDKILAYFRNFVDLQEMAAHLTARLQGCASHGVPFTAEISGSGLLSWGVDPQAEAQTAAWPMRESWRARICNRLATALLYAKAAATNGPSPLRFAIERLRLDGIDPDTWTHSP